jgi:hypothetical protein
LHLVQSKGSKGEKEKKKSINYPSGEVYLLLEIDPEIKSQCGTYAKGIQ